MISFFMCAAGSLSMILGQATASSPFLPPQDMTFLSDIAVAVLQESLVAPGASVGGVGPNSSGGTLIRPGGREDYPAFWIRDYAMSLDADIISVTEQRHALFLAAGHQIDSEVRLPTGSVLPPGSIPDHISFGGTPIFFPGVLQEYDKQGGPQWGMSPCLDDQFFFIHMARAYWAQSKETSFLQETVKGKTLLQRLEEAFTMPPARRDSGLVYTEEDIRGVNFGFFDTVVHTGSLFFCSLLKFRAAGELAELCQAAGMPEKSAQYRDAGARIQQALISVFRLPSGWYRASTGLSGQPDVWGTAFAVYIGALRGEDAQAACRVLAEALRQGTIAWNGAIRHVPTCDDFSEKSAWEKAYAAKNQYQNGAYWATPTGWVCYAVRFVDPALSSTLAMEYIKELRSGDFRKGADVGSPWECMHPDGNHRQNPIYLTSVTAPLAAFQRIAQ